ncbi:DUF2384 domain-containing protein [Cereibacter sphaeroides]|uniref:antitoxin Xre/MbcA/ParS toxin-binding domain-containing protein n=1 Tax=Cereibacter sphaeroides TaxID=1063 RepID=UPI001F300BBD|nr:antitoxin Xre/MbcA/ParS toxin-binding domain-containing protein [Cereibacter sphaeroides]MCE6957866.1 DUF2384 domain-containing protein [Cereibacter sphaeroides]MCE6971835.1 DUF2384 domain-containing protein [Cereibacter sphaeroides]
MIRKQIPKGMPRPSRTAHQRRIIMKDTKYLVLQKEGEEIRLLVERDDDKKLVLRKIRNPGSAVSRRRGMLARVHVDPEMPGEPVPVELPRPEAYRPDARARAILRGVEIAEQDLAAAGGAYDLAEVQRLMRGVSRQAVDKRVQDGSLLAVPGPSNRKVYPTLQFTRDGSPVPGLKGVRNALGVTSPWSVLNFLANPHDALGGRKPIDLLKEGETGLVIRAAEGEGQSGA